MTDPRPDDRPDAGPAHARPAGRVGGARVAPPDHHRAVAVIAEPSNAATHPAGALVGGAGAVFADAPSEAKTALKAHDAEVKASHGAGKAHDPTHSKAGGKKGIDPGLGAANNIMDSRRAAYGVPQSRRTDGGR